MNYTSRENNTNAKLRKFMLSWVCALSISKQSCLARIPISPG